MSSLTGLLLYASEGATPEGSKNIFKGEANMGLLSKEEMEKQLYHVSDEAQEFMREELKNFNLSHETTDALFQLCVRLYNWGHSDGYAEATEVFY